MSSYTEFTFNAQAAQFEILIAFLSQYPFESFQEENDRLIGWIQTDHIPSEFISTIKEQIPVPFECSSKVIKQQNWNEVWESGFDPVIVDDFCAIRADFHESNTRCTHEIVINPKMSFGTGHHETTELMIRQMKDMVFSDLRVFDFGTGTGILAILASFLGATHIIGIDHEDIAVENALENTVRNNTPEINITAQDITTYADQKFDIILANVNRNAILSNLESLSQMTTNRGHVLVSGILTSDQKIIQDAFLNKGYELNRLMKKGEWLCFDFVFHA